MRYFKYLFSGKYSLVSFFLFLFTFLVIIYISIHSSFPKHQGKIVVLEASQIEFIKQIYDAENDKLINADSLKNYYSVVTESKIAELEGLSDRTQKQDSILDNLLLKGQSIVSGKSDSVLNKLVLLKKTGLINEYLKSIDITTQFKKTDLEAAMLGLSQRRFDAKSYFFLKNWWVLLEILLFALIGVVCNSLYFMSEFIRKEEFDPNETVVYFVKLFYTPVVVLIIYLGAEQFLGQESNVLPSPSNTIVLSFVLGFFSGRTIELLNRIKDALFPLKANDESKNKIGTKEARLSFLKLNDQNQRRVIKEYLKANQKKLLEDYPEIKGFSVSRRNNIKSEPFCLTIDIGEKLPEYSVKKMIPKQISFTDSEGKLYVFETDINGVGQPSASLVPDDKYFVGDGIMPKKIGLSCSRQDSTNDAGTIGLKVTRDGKPHLLSCYHVLCRPELYNNEELFLYEPSGKKKIVSPANKDGDKPEPIATFRYGFINSSIDGAVAELKSDDSLKNEFYKVGGKPNGVMYFNYELDYSGEPIKLIGRTSKLSYSRIISIDHYITEFYYVSNGKIVHRQHFDSIIKARKFSNKGDSGGVVLNENNQIIGLLFGDDDMFSYIIPYNALKVNLTIQEP